MDGYPRNLDQAVAFDAVTAELSLSLDHVIELLVDEWRQWIGAVTTEVEVVPRRVHIDRSHNPVRLWIDRAVVLYRRDRQQRYGREFPGQVQCRR